MVFAYNPEMWKHMYGDDVQVEGGTLVRYPTTEEDLEEMAREWEAAGFAPS